MCLEKEEEDSSVLRITLMHQRLEDYIKNGKERLITAVNNSIDNISTSRKTKKAKRQKLEENQLHGYF